VLDATGQARAVVDARGNEAFTYARDLRGRVVAQASVDAGPTWAVTDGYDRAVQSWDARGFAVTRGFDVADRPTTVHVTGGDGVTAMDAVVETYLYGDQAADRAAAVAANTVGRLVEVKDGAGVVSVSAYDPLGAVRAQGRRLRATVDEAPDWRGAEALESEVLTTVARTDALGREVWTALVDGTVRASTYARGGALASVRVTTPDGALVEAPIVEGLTRDAHGRVVAATLGNGVGQTWAYDPASGRLVAQDAVRGTRAYQGLRCTYDPDGKLVRMLDVAQDGPGAFVPGAVSARRDFGYDAHGRLVEATGRVHQALLPHDGPTTAGCVHGARHLSLNNGAALERYTQRFSYDAGGNLTRVQHAGTTASWATDYWVAAGSNRSTPAADGNGVPVVDPAGMFDAGGQPARAVAPARDGLELARVPDARRRRWRGRAGRSTTASGTRTARTACACARWRRGWWSAGRSRSWRRGKSCTAAAGRSACGWRATARWCSSAGRRMSATATGGSR
jgi:hypothetical protein